MGIFQTKLIKRYGYLLALLSIHLLFLVHLLHPGIPTTHDGLLHIARIGAYHKAFVDRQIPPRWASDLNYSYGTPLFIFYYPLPGYLGSALHTIFNLQDSYKLVIGLAFLIAPISFYLWIKEKFNPLVAFIASLLYGLAPYHLLDLYVRGAISDLLAFVFIPLVFLAVDKINKSPKPTYIFFGSIAYALMVLSQNALGLIFTFVLFFYCLLQAKNNMSALKSYIFLFIFGLSLSAFFWLPSLVEQRYTHATLFLGNKFRSHFPTLMQLIYSPWGFGVNVANSGGLSPQIGIAQLLFFFLGVKEAFISKKILVHRIFWIIIFIISIFFSLSVSKFVWENNTILQKFEFPWRFTAISSFACAAIAPYVLKNFRSTLLYMIMLVIIIVSLPFNKVISYQNKNDLFYLSYPATTDFGAATTRWVASEPTQYPSAPIEIIAGSAIIANIHKKATSHSFNVLTKETVTLLDNTMYFPGWRVTVDGNLIPIEFQDALHRGLITFHIPPGNHLVRVFFQETFIRRLGNAMSILSFIAIVGILLGINNKQKRTNIK